MSDVYRVGGADTAPDEDIGPRHGLLLDHHHGGAHSPGAWLTGRCGARASGAWALGRCRLGCSQSCKNPGSVVALLQGNFEKSHDFKANFEEKRAVLMRLQKLDDNFLPLNSIQKIMSKNPKTFDHTHIFHGQT